MELLKLVLPVLGPVVIGILTALVGSAVLSSGRLRRDLAVDAELLEKLPPHVQEQMREDVGRRTLHLIAITRHPVLTLADLLSLAGFLLVVALGIGNAVANLTDDDRNWDGTVGALFAVPVFGAAAWGAFHQGWTRRGLARLQYTEEQLGTVDAAERARVLGVARRVSRLGAALLVGGTVAAVAITMGMSLEWPQVAHVGAGALLGGAAAWLVMGIVEDGDLTREIGRLVRAARL